MTYISAEELREHADELIVRANQGEELVITLDGRPVAQLLPPLRSTSATASE